MGKNNLAPQLVDEKIWQELLARRDQGGDIFVGQKGKGKTERDPHHPNQFIGQKVFGHAQFNPSARNLDFKIESIEQKPEVLDQIEKVLRRESGIEGKTDRVLLIAEEILLNGLISAPRVASEVGIQISPPNPFVLNVEWTPNELWIHGLDAYGVFFRKNFGRTFSNTEKEKTHGHSGKGLDLILDSATDLFIRSKPNWGTWVAARVDLNLTNSQNDLEPKRLLLDFES